MSDPSGPACLSSLTHTLTWLLPTSLSEVVQVQEFSGTHEVCSFNRPSVEGPFRKNLNSSGSFSGSDAVAFQVMAAPEYCGLDLSDSSFSTTGVLFTATGTGCGIVALIV